jgi:glycosyltransferase involved in cell wall biosynthesis
MAAGVGVAMISSVFYPSIGGAQRVVLETGRLLRERGVSVFVVTRHHRGLRRFEEVEGMPTYRVGFGDAGKAAAAITYILGAIWLLFRLRGHFTVLHCHQMISPMTIGLIARALLHRPLVIMPHRSGDIGDIGVLTRRRPVTGRLRLAAARRWGDAFICISPAIRAELQSLGVPDARLWEIPNGVNVERMRPVTPQRRSALRRELGLPDVPLAIFTGRLAPEKRLDVLVAAWPQLVARVPDACLLLVGAGPERAGLAAQARRLLVADRIIFYGQCDDVTPLLQASNVFILPSAAEGLPVALLEAQACGLPCVATDVDGNTEVVQDGVNGRLVPPGDRVALGRALIEAFTLSQAQSWGRRGRDHILSQFTLNAVVDRHLQMYRAISPHFARLERPAEPLAEREV